MPAPAEPIRALHRRQSTRKPSSQRASALHVAQSPKRTHTPCLPAPTSAQRVAQRREPPSEHRGCDPYKSGSPIPAPRASPRRARQVRTRALPPRSTLATARVLHHQVQRWYRMFIPVSIGAMETVDHGWHAMSIPASPAVQFTERQGQYLAFIHAYTKVNGRPPAQLDMQRFLQSPRQPSTRWCSAWNVADCFAAPRDRPAASKFSSPRGSPCLAMNNRFQSITTSVQRH